MTSNYIESNTIILTPVVTKSSRNMQNDIRNEKGQITVFFAIACLVIVTLIAFVINIGLFVKAKINLQNATDAAAWSGAATQARQLTDIGYLNWEMRNIYKQWLFRYYVLGNLSTKGVQSPGSPGNNNYVTGSNNVMDFTMGPANSEDKFNVPSVCIHPRSSVNQNDLCSIYKVPGLPRISFGFGSIDQTIEAITDSLSKEKATDCSARSKANFNIALAWIYGTGATAYDQKILKDAPQAAINIPGAWVKALELTHRIRNLEYIVNSPPKSSIDKSTIVNLENENWAGNERTIKAFSSAYRNLGNDSIWGSEIKNSFLLTEISPSEYVVNDPNDLSSLFIPNSYPKFYLDLRLIPLNFVNFFTSLIPFKDQAKPDDTQREGACEVSKIAIPVPGYPFGFTKNPELVTYYAVKGEASFSGLFNPIKSIRLTAFAAAKPFGGRIGPPTFNNFEKSAPNSVFARTGSKLRSLPFALGLRLDPSLQPGQNGNKSRPAIVPADNNLWVSNPDDVIGGSTDNTGKIKYVIPNLIYDDPNNSYTKIHNNPFFIYNLPAGNKGNVPWGLGLYNVSEFNSFSSTLGGTTGTITSKEVENALLNVKHPTKYETMNYLIPTPDLLNRNVSLNGFVGLDTIGLGRKSINDPRFPIYAPLYGDSLLYETPIAVLDSIKKFLRAQEPTINIFIKNLFDISKNLRALSQSNQNSSFDIYGDAANFFFDYTTEDFSKISCKSMAGQFLYYFYGSESKITCNGVVPLPDALDELYGNNPTVTSLIEANHYNLDLYYEGTDQSHIFTAYAPGELSGANGGIISNPFLGTEKLSIRNSYSTKLISIQSVMGNNEQSFGSNFPLMSEGSYQDITGQTNFFNTLKLEESTSIPSQEIFQ